MKTTNRNFKKLSGLGTINGRNRVTVHTATSEEIGISVTQPGSKKATTLEIIVPTSRSGVGSRRATRVSLNGHQARELYETLRAHYENRTENDSLESAGFTPYYGWNYLY